MSVEEEKVLSDFAVAGHGGLSLIEGPEPHQIQKLVISTSELNFYESLSGRNLSEIERNLFPAYYGTVEQYGGTYITMENLLVGYDKPCMLDIKMGKSSVSHDSLPDRVSAVIKKDLATTSHSLGVRICGYKTFDLTTGLYKKVVKNAVREAGVEKDTFLVLLRDFFSDGVRLRTEVVQHFVPLLSDIHDWFSSQSQVCFISMSLLFVYDAANPAPNGRVKLIDFAHVFDLAEGQHDDNVLFGVDNLLQYFKDDLH